MSGEESTVQALPGGFGSRLRRRLRDSGFVRRPASFYERHKRYAPVLFFFGGVAWDALTLTRIDRLADNLLLLGYLLVLGGLVVIATLAEYGRLEQPLLLRYRAYYPAAIQFFLGALFSAYVVYYGQSVSFTETAVFFVLLIGLLVANEFIQKRLTNLYLLIALYFLVSFSFFIFFVPVVFRMMNYWMFLLGGLLGAGLVGTLVFLLREHEIFADRKSYLRAQGIVAGMLVLFNLFYLLNWIPPVPLALRFAGIYHHYDPQTHTLTYERPPWYAFWRESERTFHRAPGEPVYAFAAVFAPTDLRQRIYHVWQFRDPERGWVTADRITYRSGPIRGRQMRGYRGYTRKTNIQPGRWRVQIETEHGRILGRIPFRVVPVDTPVADFETLVYD